MRQIYTSEATGRRISRKLWLEQQVSKQRQWIDQCHASSRSYAGPNALKIMAADRAALAAYEGQLVAIR